MLKTTELEVPWTRADLEEVIEQAVLKAVTKAMKGLKDGQGKPKEVESPSRIANHPRHGPLMIEGGGLKKPAILEQINHLKELATKLEAELAYAAPPPVLDEDYARHVAVLAVQIHAETHLRPTQVTQKQAAEMLGISHVTVRKLIRAGVIRMNACGQIPIEQIDLARAAPKFART